MCGAFEYDDANTAGQSAYAMANFRVAVRAPDAYLQLLAAGLSTVLGLQALVILGGAVRLLPLTGIPLPFVSYGGSALLTNYIVIGLLLRISAEYSSASAPAR